MSNVVTAEVAQKVLDTVNAGLVSGMGIPEPGRMCVEAAVCYAMGLPHSDRPTCVGEAVRRFKIKLNDAIWSSDKARTDGLRKLAIAQLGSDSIDQKAFATILAKKTIQKIVPMALRATAKRVPSKSEELESAAVRCEKEGTQAAARNARDVARTASAYASAASAAYAAYAFSDAAASAAADAAAYAASASHDEVLMVSCQIGLEALIELKSPGCEFLYLVG